MITSQKAALSLLISVILFVVFAALAFTGLFSLIEANFYNPTIIANMARDNDRNAEVIDKFFLEMQDRFSETLKTPEVRRSFLSSQSPEDVLARSRIYNLLIESFNGVQWVRFIDSGGRRLLFSSLSHDIVNQDGNYPIYRNYDESDNSYETIAVDDGGTPKYTFDGKSEQILFSFPLYDTFDIYWGTALFSLSMDAVLNRLISEGRMRFSQEVMLISNPPGLVFGMSLAGERALPSQISAIWRAEGQKTTKLVSPSSGISLALITAETSQNFFVGRLINEEQFSFTLTMKIILLASFFLTVYLIIFLLFSLRQDPVTIIQSRIKQLQISIFEQFYELKGEADWNQWIRELEHRRGEITVQLKQGLKGVISGDIDVLIHKSWDDLLKVLGSTREAGINEEKLRSIIKEILAAFPSAGTAQPSAAGKVISGARHGLLMKASALVQKIEDAELVEEAEYIGELEELPAGPQGELSGTSADKVEESDAVSREDIAYLASQIEFAPVHEPDITDEETVEQFLEIVSPFSSMLDDLSSDPDIEILEPLLEKDEEPKSGDVIKERGGVPFISGEVLSPASEEKTVVNRDFKDLVDSVIK